MQDKQETWQALPPVGWQAYCRFVQDARVNQPEQPRSGKRKDDHANAN